MLSVFYRLGRCWRVLRQPASGTRCRGATAFPVLALRAIRSTSATVLSIWGLFLVLRFPHGDWWLLPALETVVLRASARGSKRAAARDCRRPMPTSKADLHVHSKYSDRPSEWILRRLGAPECYTPP